MNQHCRKVTSDFCKIKLQGNEHTMEVTLFMVYVIAVSPNVCMIRNSPNLSSNNAAHSASSTCVDSTLQILF